MFLPGFRSLWGNDPELRQKVEFGPSGADRLARARGGQDREFERPSRCPALVPQGGHEARHLRVGRGVVMLHAGDLAARREQLVEVTSPTRRVIAGPMSADGRPAQDRFDAPARPIRGLRLFLPNGLQNLQDERGIDRVDGKVVYCGRQGRILPLPAPRLIKGGDSLVAVFRVPPAGPVRLDVTIRALLERDRPRGCEPDRTTYGLSLLDRTQPS